MNETTGMIDKAVATWQGWGVTAWFVLGLVLVVLLRRRLMRMARRRAARAIMTAALTAWLGTSAISLSIADFAGSGSAEHCAGVEHQELSIKNAPGKTLCVARDRIDQARDLFSG